MEVKDRFKDKYIDPFTDFGFKKLFGEECNKDLLLDFLSELLHKNEGKIVNLTYLKSEQLGRSEEDRKAVFDLHYENEKGEKFKDIDELENHFEKWMYVLKNLNRLDRLPDKLREKVFEKMFVSAEISKLTIEEYLQYINSLKIYRDNKNSIDTARDEGIAEGKIEGKIEEKLEIAKNAKSLGLSIEQIQKLTHLSIEEIEKMK